MEEHNPGPGRKRRILVSACLAGEYCRWDGGTNLVPEIKSLVDSGNAVVVCPEELGGLPTPRLPSERIGGRVVSSDGRDVTAGSKPFPLSQRRFCTAALSG